MRRLAVEALVVLVADHAVAFVPGASRRFVELSNFAEVASVPLLVKAPGQPRGGRSDELAQTFDVLPTIGDVLGTSWKAEGQSLRKPVTRQRVRVSNYAKSPLSADREGLMELRRVALRRLEASLGAPPR